MIDQEKIELAAQVAHEANRAYCERLGDTSQTVWAMAPDWQRNSAIAGVHAVKAGSTPEQSHEGWMEMKLREGWVLGATKDPEKKTHPCLVPYDQLPPEQRLKDHIFVGVVRAVLAAFDH